MKIRTAGLVVAALWMSGTLVGAQRASLGAQRAEPIQPITPVLHSDTPIIELGKKLYFDPRLSKSGFISCNSCHNLSMGGSDNLATSIGHNWQKGPINAPTVLNSSMNVAQFWVTSTTLSMVGDGSAATAPADSTAPAADVSFSPVASELVAA